MRYYGTGGYIMDGFGSSVLVTHIYVIEAYYYTVDEVNNSRRRWNIALVVTAEPANINGASKCHYHYGDGQQPGGEQPGDGDGSPSGTRPDLQPIEVKEPSFVKEVVLPTVKEYVTGEVLSNVTKAVAIGAAGTPVGAVAGIIHIGLSVRQAWNVGTFVGGQLSSEELVNDFATALYVHQDALENGTFSLDQAFSGQEFAFPFSLSQDASHEEEDGSSARRFNALFSGSVNFSRFDDRSADGNSTTYSFGLDVLPNPDVPLVTGLQLAFTRINADFEDVEFDSAGTYGVNLFTVSPTVAWDATDKLTLWSSIGWGRGEMDFTIDTVANTRLDALESISMTNTGDFFSAGAGANMRVWESAASALSFQVGGSTTSFLDADRKQGRVAAQFSHDFPLEAGRLRSAANLAWLLSDADPGAIELSGALNWLPDGGRLSGATSARVLLLGEDRSEWGISGGLTLQPGQQGEGLSLTLQPSFGQADASLAGLGMDAWDRYNDHLADLALSPEPLTARLHAEVAYGFRRPHALLTPYTQLNMADTSTTTSAGLRYALDDSLNLDLSASHRSRASGNNESRVFLQLRSDL